MFFFWGGEEPIVLQCLAPFTTSKPSTCIDFCGVAFFRWGRTESHFCEELSHKVTLPLFIGFTGKYIDKQIVNCPILFFIS